MNKAKVKELCFVAAVLQYLGLLEISIASRTSFRGGQGGHLPPPDFEK